VEHLNIELQLKPHDLTLLNKDQNIGLMPIAKKGDL
jgi:hypothetical protein